MSTKLILTVIVLLALGGGTLAWKNAHEAAAPLEQATTTPPVIVTEPDKPAPDDNDTTITLKLGQTGTAQGVSLTPQKPVNDSRCAQGVTCIWAGTVSVEVRLKSPNGESVQTFTMGQAVTTETKSITLIDVSPYPVKDQTIDPADYRFTFEVKAR